MELIRAAGFALLCCAAVAGFAQLPPAAERDAALIGKFSAKAAQPIQKHQSELLKRADAALLKQARFLIPQFKPYAEVPGSLSITNCKSGEHSIRPNTHTAYALASIYASIKDGYPEGITREQCRDTAIGILRFVLSTHGAGGAKCADGKQWKNQWQSALWANSAGKAAWLLWDDLPPDLRWLAARMVCDEADRFVDQDPPAQILRDTKAEENAWNSTVISLAHCMFPKHERHAKWRETAIRWSVSAFARKADLNSSEIVDGKPVKDWLVGASIHEDYTLENHDRVHPDYMNTTRINIDQVHPYKWAGLPAPDSLKYNTKSVYKVLKILAMPDGGYLYPNGQDWQLHRNPQWTDNHIGNAVLFEDAEAARLALNCLDCLERMQARDPNGACFLAEEFNFPSTQMFVGEMLANVRHMLAEYGTGTEPVSEEALLKQYAGTFVFEAGKFALVRTPTSISSFSWGNQPMGMAMPLGTDLLLSPNERNMIGTIQLSDAKPEKPVVKEFKLAEAKEGFGVSGLISRAGGAVEQRFAFAALPDGRSVYIDQLTATTSTQIAKLVLGQLAVLNDRNWVYHDGKRTLTHDKGRQEFTAAGEEKPATQEFSSRWFNLDEKLGIICLKTSGRQTYFPNHKQGNGRLEQIFSLNSPSLNDRADVKPGDVFAESVLVFCPAMDSSATKTAAAKCTLEQPAASKYEIHMADGTIVRADLSSSQVSW